MSLRVIRLAGGSALQDGGRPGWRRCGVPPGGAFDRESFALALALVGCRQGAVLELLMMGGEFECVAEDRIAVVGPKGSVELDRESLSPNSSIPVRPGQRLVVGPAESGARTYLASARGWAGSAVLGSLSNVAPAEPHPDETPSTDSRGAVRLEEPPGSLVDRPLRILPGPQTRPHDLDDLSSQQLSVSLASNRLGIRLEKGECAAHEELASEPSCPGAVQLTPSGELIIHGPDGPTLGGYPKIAVVIDADFDRLAQLRPFDLVSFEWVDWTTAREASHRERERIARRCASLRAVAQN